MSTSRGVAAHYLEAALQHAGLDADQTTSLLAAAGLSPEVLHAQPPRRIDDRQYTAVMTGLMKRTNNEFLYFTSPRTPHGSFAMMCRSLIHLPTLRPALLRGLRFYEMFTGDLHFRLHPHQDTIEVSMHLDDPAVDPLHLGTETIMTMVHRLASWLIDQRIPLIEATFAYPPPAHVEEYHLLFHCPLRFNRPRTSLVFNAVYLNYPLMQNEESLKKLLRDTARLFVPPHNTQLLTAQIRALLGKDFTREFPEFEEVAAQLMLTPQTLRRRLKEENSSYQGIKDQVRRDAAIYYLSRPQLGIAEIAQLMGFSEPSTFHRAFKKWTGLTPGEYRQGLHQ